VFAIEISLRILTFEPPTATFFRHSRAGFVLTGVLGRIRYCMRPINLFDILAVLALVPALRGLRALRILRLARTARIFRYSNPIKGLSRAFEDNRLLYVLAFSILAIVTVLGGTTMYLVESGHNEQVSSIGDGIWWALVTLSTVGFGDVTPVTDLGRVVGGVLMIAGMFTLALFAGIVGRTLVLAVLGFNVEQFRMSALINHIVICGYDSGSELLLDAMRQEFDTERTEVLVFAEGDRPMEVPLDFKWVTGDPSKESELDKVRINRASAAIVVGLRTVPPHQADAITILRVFTIRSYLSRDSVAQKRDKPLYIVAEILDSENVAHAHKAGADEVIESTRIGFSLLAHAAAMPGSADIVERLALLGAHNLYLGCVPDEIVTPAQFGEVARQLKELYSVQVIGIWDSSGRSEELNPPDHRHVDGNTQLIYLAESEKLPRCF